MGTQWSGMGREFMILSPFKDTIIRCHNALKSEGFDLMSLIESDDETVYDDPQNASVAICAIQVFLKCLIYLFIIYQYLISGKSLQETIIEIVIL